MFYYNHKVNAIVNGLKRLKKTLGIIGDPSVFYFRFSNQMSIKLLIFEWTPRINNFYLNFYYRHSFRQNVLLKVIIPFAGGCDLFFYIVAN